MKKSQPCFNLIRTYLALQLLALEVQLHHLLLRCFTIGLCSTAFSISPSSPSLLEHLPSIAVDERVQGLPDEGAGLLPLGL
jgi:hypothetical protein